MVLTALKEGNQNGRFSLKRNWIKLMLGLNTTLKNPLDTLQKRLRSQYKFSSFKHVLFPKINFIT
jgi:hypothetical protein